MGIQNKPSLARKRLSTLAVTTTLAAVGVGVIGTGAANAATTSGIAHTADTQATSNTTLDFSVAPGTGADSQSAVLDITGIVDSTATKANVKVTVDWGDSSTSDIAINNDLTLAATHLSHPYSTAKKYTVTLKVEDGIAAAHALDKTHDVTVTTPVTVAAPVLKADVSTMTPAAGSAVVVKLAGSTIDPTAVTAGKATTTISWGDKTADTVLSGDPAAINANDPKLAHPYAAGSYVLSVTLDDGLGNKNSKTDAKTFNITVSATGTVTVTVNRAAGDDRYKTGLQISQHAWADNGKSATDPLKRQQAKAVVLATGNAFPDALAGVPLAKKAGGPLLLTDGTAATTNPDVVKEIQRILPTAGTTVFVLGGEKAVSAGIQAELAKLGYNVVRLAGQDRFGTALAIAQDPRAMNNPTHLIVARGDNGTNNNGFADALAAGPYAADVFGGGNSAIVLSNGPTLDPNTAAYVQGKLKSTEIDVAAIGGPAVAATKTVTGAVLQHKDSTNKLVGNFVGAVGATRYETAAMVATTFGANAPVGIATGLKFPDALTGGAYMATANGPLLLTDPSTLSPATEAALKTVAATTKEIDIFGGEAAVSKSVATAIAAVVKVTAIGKF